MPAALVLFAIIRVVVILWALSLAWRLRSWRLALLPLAILTMTLPLFVMQATGAPLAFNGDALGGGAKWLIALTLLIDGAVTFLAVYFLNHFLHELFENRRSLREYVSQRQQADQQLAFHADVLSQINAAVFSCRGAEMIVDYWNEGAESLYGVSARDAIGQPFDTLFDYRWLQPGDLEDCVRTLMTTGRWTGENMVLTRGGKQIYTKTAVRMYVDEESLPVRSISVIHDITARKHLEQDLRDRESLLQHMFDHAADLVAFHDPAGQIVRVNETALRELGYSREEALKLNIFEMLSEFPADLPQRLLDAKLGETVDARVVCRRKDGSTFPVEASGVASEFGGQSRMLVIARNISEKLEAERELREREAELAHVTRLSQLGAMVAGISHEIKQPLYAIGNYVAAATKLLQGDENLDRAELLQWQAHIAEQAERASAIIDRLRQFARKETPPRQILNLAELIEQTRELVALDASQRNIALHWQEASAEILISGDRIGLQQVLVNLLYNAFAAIEQRESGPRQVTLTVSRKPECVQISVADTGIGLPVNTERLFEPFQTDKPEGLGLGLSISRSIVEVHGGRIWAEENPDCGSVFSFTLPIAAKQPEIGGPGEEFAHILALR